MSLEVFMTNLKSRGISAETEVAYRSDLAIFRSFLDMKGLAVENVRPSDIEQFVQFLRQRPARKGTVPSPTTINRRLSVVSSLYEFLRMYTNGSVTNPITRFARPKSRRPKPSPISDADAVQLEAIDNLRDRAVLSLFLASAARLSELHQLNRDSITVMEEPDASGNMMTFGRGFVLGKGSKIREFLVDINALGVVADYLNTRTDDCPALFISERGSRLAKRTIEDVLHRWCKRLHLSPARVHQLRHTAITRLAGAGMSVVALKELAGHESITTTMRYLQPNRRRVLQEYFAAMAELK